MGSGKHGHGHSHYDEEGKSKWYLKVIKRSYQKNRIFLKNILENQKFCGCCFCSNVTRLTCMLILTLIFFFLEIIVGQISNSITLTADSFHMFSDAIALTIGLVTGIVNISFI